MVVAIKKFSICGKVGSVFNSILSFMKNVPMVDLYKVRDSLLRTDVGYSAEDYEKHKDSVPYSNPDRIFLLPIVLHTTHIDSW